VLIPPNVLNVVGCASRDPARYQLCGVLLERKGERQGSATATDGKTLAHVTWMEDEQQDFPERGVNPAPAPKASVIIPTAAVKELAGMAPKKPLKPVLRNVVMDEHTLNGTATFLATELGETDRRATVKTLEGTYPDAGFALRSCKPETSVRVNPFLLIRALETYVKTMGLKKTGAPDCTIDICGPSPIRIRGACDDREVTVLAMPLTTK